MRLGAEALGGSAEHNSLECATCLGLTVSGGWLSVVCGCVRQDPCLTAYVRLCLCAASSACALALRVPVTQLCAPSVDPGPRCVPVGGKA